MSTEDRHTRHTVTVDRDGAIQIPDALRHDLELFDGDDVVFEMDGSRLTLRKRPSEQTEQFERIAR